MDWKAPLRAALIIPARNEAATIAAVVQAVRPWGQVIVVDDAGTDYTGVLARQAGAWVIRNARNLQYEGSLAAGLNLAVSKGFDVAVTLDADGQHSARDVPRLLARLADGADLVIGVRPQAARLGELLFRIAGRRLWGMDDPLCGLKGYRLDWVRRLGVQKDQHSIGTRLAITMVRAGARLQQLPITIHPRRDSPRFGGRIKANLLILRALILSLAYQGRPLAARNL